MLKKIGDSIKEASVLILILGFLKQLIYYTNYNIPIKYFLGLSDLWLFIADDLIYTAPFTFMIILAVNIASKEKKVDKKEDPEKEVDEKTKRKEKLVMRIFQTFYSALFFLSLFYLFYNKEYYMKVIMILSMVGCAFFIVFVSQPDDKKIFTNVSYTIVFGLCFITAMLIFKTTMDIRNVDNKLYKGTIVSTSDSTYISTDSSYFIGKTEKYVFIYNKKDSTTSIIPTELVTKIVMKRK